MGRFEAECLFLSAVRVLTTLLSALLGTNFALGTIDRIFEWDFNEGCLKTLSTTSNSNVSLGNSYTSKAPHLGFHYPPLLYIELVTRRLKPFLKGMGSVNVYHFSSRYLM